MTETQSGLFWQNEYEGEIGPELSSVEKQLRDLFIQNYMIDYDGYTAAIRCGFTANFAEQYAREFLGESYVQNEIARLRSVDNFSEEEQLAQDRALISNTLRQACNNGPYASRVAAAKALAEVRGLSKPQGVDTENELIEAFKSFAKQVPL